MRKVDLNMKESLHYDVIKKLIETDGNKHNAAIRLNCSIRHINRMIKGFKEHGKGFFIHKNKNSKPHNTFPEDFKKNIIFLYQTKYFDSNFKHFSELLYELENISLSYSALKCIMREYNIISPKANRSTKRLAKKLFQANAPEVTDDLNLISDHTVDKNDAHPRRPRSTYFGEMIQMDASQHIWFNGTKCHLHTAVDDATSSILAAYFDVQETLNGYYNLAFQLLTTYGIPYMFYTDRRTIFDYKRVNDCLIESDAHTQFAYACSQLGSDLKVTSIPQAKGRVERSYGTLQSRLVVELRLAGVKTLDEANIFIQSYIHKYNALFALPNDKLISVFETAPSLDKIKNILATLSERKVDNGHAIKYKNAYYSLLDSNSKNVYLRKGTKCVIINNFDNELYASVDQKVYSMQEIPEHELESRNFSIVIVKPPKKIYIPPMSHPWRHISFQKHFLKQKQ